MTEEHVTIDYLKSLEGGKPRGAVEQAEKGGIDGPGEGESVTDEQRAEGSRIGFTTVSFCGVRGKYGRQE